MKRPPPAVVHRRRHGQRPGGPGHGRVQRHGRGRSARSTTSRRWPRSAIRAATRPTPTTRPLINWGDGHTSAGTILNGVVSGSHTYAEESGAEHASSSPYDITVTISHEATPAAVVHDQRHGQRPGGPATGGFSVTAVTKVRPVNDVQTVATFSDPGTRGDRDAADYSRHDQLGRRPHERRHDRQRTAWSAAATPTGDEIGARARQQPLRHHGHDQP